MGLWRDEFKEAIRSYEDASKFFETSLPKLSYDIFIPLTFARKIKAAGKDSALWKQFIPHSDEKEKTQGRYDPIGDKDFSPVPQIVHRYKNRVLLFPTPICPVICRYCFRKNELSSSDEIFTTKLDQALNYIKQHTEINEVILSGGDPLILSTNNLRKLIKKISNISHIKFLRFHTRTPIILPSRITKEFTDFLEEASQLFSRVVLIIHTNHQDEIDDDVKKCFLKLKKCGIDILSQSVLLKNINDSKEELLKLFNKLIINGVTPYYLHHPDQVRGASHFQLPLLEGRKIYSQLTNELPGWAIPKYIIDIPHGEGKVSAFNPESFEFSGRLINKSSEYTSYNDA